MTEAEADVLATPIGFAEGCLGARLYPWQDEVLTWFENTLVRTKGSLVTPNGAGKTSGVVAVLALWWLAVHRQGKVVYTTKDGKQLHEQLFPALEKHRPRLPGWTWVRSPYIQITTPTGGRFIGFTTDDPGRAEGHHKGNDFEGPLLMIVDEAKSVSEQIFEAIDRCTFSALLLVSSPGVKKGRFWDSFNRLANQFVRRQVSLTECPHIPREKIDDIIATYGPDHPFTQSAVHGKFMDEDDENAFVFPMSLIEAVKGQSVSSVNLSARQAGFCDFAAGGAENVFAFFDGRPFPHLICWRDKNTMSAVGRFITEFRRAGLKAAEIFGDETGLGKPMCDALAEADFAIHRVNNGSPANNAHRYMNRGAEIWHEAAASLRRGEWQLPDDPVLLAQLTCRKISYDSKGRLGVESKEDMSKRGVSSPDRADAVCGAVVCSGIARSRLAPPMSIPTLDEAEEHAGRGRFAGFDAGY
jgi:phage terminase large subunit